MQMTLMNDFNTTSTKKEIYLLKTKEKNESLYNLTNKPLMKKLHHILDMKMEFHLHEFLGELLIYQKSSTTLFELIETNTKNIY